jgi:uncharacterized protein YcfJ
VAALAVALAVATTAGAAWPLRRASTSTSHGARGRWSGRLAIAAAAPAGFRRPPVGPGRLRYRAEVVALFNPDYGPGPRRQPPHGPFAVVDRVTVFEDEGRTRFRTNPRSVLRTVLMDDQKYSAPVESHLQALRGLVSGAVEGTPAGEDYGQRREKGTIGKTMGVMAGGPFGDKVADVAVVAGGDWKGVAERVRVGLEKKEPKWGLHLTYVLEIPEAETVVLGTTGTPMDSRSFEIVGAGADSTRDGGKCPGLAHAGAYPIEVVVARDAGAVHVRLVESMYRMKMYFEDAGKWAFMKNMGMPGSIADEISAQIRPALAAR